MKTIEEATKENFISAQLMSDMRLKTMKIRPYFNPTSIIEMAKRSGYLDKIIETDISISYRVFKNKQTDILHIYYKK